MPEGLTLKRTTEDFDQSTVPPGLLKAHRIATGVWGVLRVREGSVRFILEDRFVLEDDSVAAPVVDLGPGESTVIPTAVPHRVELGPDARFAVEFYR